jgi:hypothetical protein
MLADATLRVLQEGSREADDVNDPETIIALKRIELNVDPLPLDAFDDEERKSFFEEHKFCFEITVGLCTFTLTVPVFAERNTEPNEMWASAYCNLFSVLNEATKVATELIAPGQQKPGSRQTKF